MRLATHLAPHRGPHRRYLVPLRATRSTPRDTAESHKQRRSTHTTTDAKWGHFKPPRRGQCKPPRPGLHRAKQKGLPVAFVGAGLPLIPELTADAKSYAVRMFTYPTIGALGHDAARDALVLPARAQGVDWQPAATEHVLTYTEGYPYFIHAYGRKAWAQSEAPRITLKDALAVKAIVEDWLDDNFFEARMARMSDSERAYVSAIAALGDGPQSSTAVAKQLGRPPSSLTRTRDELLRNSIVYAPRRGQIDFTVPHCAAFVRRRYPS